MGNDIKLKDVQYDAQIGDARPTTLQLAAWAIYGPGNAPNWWSVAEVQTAAGMRQKAVENGDRVATAPPPPVMQHTAKIFKGFTPPPGENVDVSKYVPAAPAA